MAYTLADSYPTEAINYRLKNDFKDLGPHAFAYLDDFPKLKRSPYGLVALSGLGLALNPPSMTRRRAAEQHYIEEDDEDEDSNEEEEDNNEPISEIKQEQPKPSPRTFGRDDHSASQAMPRDRIGNAGGVPKQNWSDFFKKEPVLLPLCYVLLCAAGGITTTIFADR
eukprot:TRINITY_DN945_c0_g1_i1.p1 TRINITY_DN945_c0_g1~~TRINITY_DN945_c0_g1_i1.p1  ORF type:complete len:167 (-),score=7.79 TRINITY_DN945_c0_g1_i1:154-654(-)